MVVCIWMLIAIFSGMVFVAIVKKSGSIYDKAPSEKNPFEGKRVVFVERQDEPMNADGICGHLEAVSSAAVHKEGVYELVIKRILDIVISFCALVVLSPLYAIIAVAIVVDDPGPVLFVQKRVGKYKRFFALHKFRSMKMSTPHDVPTHMLSDPDSHITRVGKVLRKFSLDELPQVWDIFISNMSFIGPRPALWNQDVLIAERDKVGANDVMPGLTGWAQVNGRDELEIEEKAKYDGEYCRNLTFKMDLTCFVMTIANVLKGSGVVEGGTGAVAVHLEKRKQEIERNEE